MRVLLDTNAFLWLQTSRSRFAAETLAMLSASDTERLLSSASSWEIAIKHALGKIALPTPPSEFVPDQMRTGRLTGLPVEHAHALHVATLPAHHRDPFDRVLIAQAQLEGLRILTSDRRFEPYDVEVIWI